MVRNAASTILVVSDSATPHRFSGYITEILLMEGYNWFTVHDLSSETLTLEALSRYQIVVLAHIDPPSEVQGLLIEYVRQGGNLIALRPPREMAGELGLSSSSGERSMVDRYISLSSICSLNMGVELGPLQFHGRGENYSWSGEPNAVVAYFAAEQDYVTNYPAIVIGTLGDGHWAVFAYDLAESTVLFHQGRREQASNGIRPDQDGDLQFKGNDLFVDFLDPELGKIPQADLHQDALVRIFEWIASVNEPIPRLWYFPDGAHAAAFINGDSDNMDRRDLDNVIATSDRYGVPYTTYLKIEHHPLLEPSEEEALRERGHDFGEHPWVDHKPTLDEMRAGLKFEYDAFKKRYGHDPITNRGHSVIWVGWTESAKYMLENGVRLDTNFSGARYHRGAYLNGSGLPVKFMDEDGQVINLYEQVTRSTDDGWTTNKGFARALSIEECIEGGKEQADWSMDRFHTVYHPYFHPLACRPSPRSVQRWLEAMLEHCTDRGFHFVSGTGWVNFNDSKRAIEMTDYRFDEDSLTMDVTMQAGSSVDGSTLALPNIFHGAAISIATLDGATMEIKPQHLEGREQVLFSTDYSAGQSKRWRIKWG